MSRIGGQGFAMAVIMDQGQKRILLVASKGGHWEELAELLPAFDGGDLTLVSTDHYEVERAHKAFEVLRDYNQNEPFKVAQGLMETRRLVRRVRPDVVVSTGAAPGLLCLFWGWRYGARTIWIDSIANGEQLTLSGKLALRFCDVVLTQWPHLAGGKVQYWGAVL